MSAPETTSSTELLLSLVAFIPIFEFSPAPSPLVKFLTNFIRVATSNSYDLNLASLSSTGGEEFSHGIVTLFTLSFFTELLESCPSPQRMQSSGCKSKKGSWLLQGEYDAIMNPPKHVLLWEFSICSTLEFKVLFSCDVCCKLVLIVDVEAKLEHVVDTGGEVVSIVKVEVVVGWRSKRQLCRDEQWNSLESCFVESQGDFVRKGIWLNEARRIGKDVLEDDRQNELAVTWLSREVGVEETQWPLPFVVQSARKTCLMEPLASLGITSHFVGRKGHILQLLGQVAHCNRVTCNKEKNQKV
eukprot:Gb_21643 [translate_table: standard]